MHVPVYEHVFGSFRVKGQASKDMFISLFMLIEYKLPSDRVTDEQILTEGGEPYGITCWEPYSGTYVGHGL